MGDQEVGAISRTTAWTRLPARVPAIALGGKTREGVLPFWHQPQDTFDKMDPGVMARTWDLALALIQEIDRR
jgi:hypothetical protein